MLCEFQMYSVTQRMQQLEPPVHTHTPFLHTYTYAIFSVFTVYKTTFDQDRREEGCETRKAWALQNQALNTSAIKGTAYAAQ